MVPRCVRKRTSCVHGNFFPVPGLVLSFASFGGLSLFLSTRTTISALQLNLNMDQQPAGDDPSGFGGSYPHWYGPVYYDASNHSRFGPIPAGWASEGCQDQAIVMYVC